MPLTHGLPSFQLHPPTGVELNSMEHLDHVVALTRRSVARTTPLRPNPALDCEISPTQLMLLDPTDEEYRMHAIMKDAGGSGANIKMSKRKLDSLGNFRYLLLSLC